MASNFIDYRKVPKVSHKGFSFASKAEAALYDQIALEERAGAVKLISMQECVYLTDARILYKPDFTVQLLPSEEIVYRELKGYSTPMFNIKKRLWEFYGPAKLEIWKPSRGGLFLDEIIVPKVKK